MDTKSDSVVALGECMVELSLEGPTRAAIGFAGDVFNTALYLRRLGRRVRFATALGDGDPFSSAILGLMAAEGLDSDLVTQVPGRLPGLYAIERDAAGERRFFYWREQAPVRQFFEVADVDGFAHAARQAQLVYISGVTLAVLGEAGRAALVALLTDLARRGVAIAFDPNYRARLWPSAAAARAAVEAVVPHCSLVSASGPDLETLYGLPMAEAAEDWARRGPLVIARAEDRSVTVFAKAGVSQMPAVPAVPAVDTTGAGDSFNAGFLAAWLQGAEAKVAVEAGRKVAAAVVQHAGAIIPASSMPQGAGLALAAAP